MNKKNISRPRTYIFNIDKDLDEELNKFYKQLNENEEVVSATPAGTKFIIITKESKNKKNILLG